MATDSRAGALEELLHLFSGAGGGSLASSAGQRSTALEGGIGDLLGGTGAVALDLGALGLVEGHASRGGHVAVNLGVELVGMERDGAGQLGAGILGDVHDTERLNVEAATSGEIVGVGNIKGDLDGLASGDALESGFRETGSGNSLTDALESDSLG